MFGFSFGEILLLAVIALVVIGPKQLPEFARQIGRLLNEIKRSTSDFAEEMKSQARIDLDLNAPIKPKPMEKPADTEAAPSSEKKDTPT